MKIAIAQLNPTVGDITGNLRKAKEAYRQAAREGADLAVFPELFITGYPPRDLLEFPWFIQKAARSIRQLCSMTRKTPKTGMLIGAPVYDEKARKLYNAALLLYRGKVAFKQAKSLLPTYDVFDEARYFSPARQVSVCRFKGERLGITICEDAWNDRQLWPVPKYGLDPVEQLVKKGATCLINIAASPFHVHKERLRYKIIRNHVRKHRRRFLFVNQVGGNDELLFDGRSFSIDRQGRLSGLLEPFKEQVRMIDTRAAAERIAYQPQPEVASIHDALVMGVRDYLSKCGFKRAVIGLSGGIDSAVTCCLAVHALGRENVMGVAMPGPYSSAGSIRDAKTLTKNLKVELKQISITSIYKSFIKAFQPHFKGLKEDVTEQNIQARIRGSVLMGLSNKYGSLLLTTGNKSESAVGYCTLYGDMNGGLAVISDVPKTMVYQVAEYINRDQEIIPRAVIKKPPSAELKPGQRDQDTLPPYPVLDDIIHYYVHLHRSADQIVKKGYSKKVVNWVIGAINKNEYKRRQAAPGLKVTSKAFGMGRRKPIAARYEYL